MGFVSHSSCIQVFYSFFDDSGNEDLILIEFLCIFDTIHSALKLLQLKNKLYTSLFAFFISYNCSKFVSYTRSIFDKVLMLDRYILLTRIIYRFHFLIGCRLLRKRFPFFLLHFFQLLCFNYIKLYHSGFHRIANKHKQSSFLICLHHICISSPSLYQLEKQV